MAINCRISAGGVLSIERKTTYVTQKCPFRKTDASVVADLFDCTHTCPHWKERPGGATATHLTLTCGVGDGHWEFTVDTDSRA